MLWINKLSHKLVQWMRNSSVSERDVMWSSHAYVYVCCWYINNLLADTCCTAPLIVNPCGGGGEPCCPDPCCPDLCKPTSSQPCCANCCDEPWCSPPDSIMDEQVGCCFNMGLGYDQKIGAFQCFCCTCGSPEFTKEVMLLRSVSASHGHHTMHPISATSIADQDLKVVTVQP